MARRDHLCAALDARLGFADVCGLRRARQGAGRPHDARASPPACRRTPTGAAASVPGAAQRADAVLRRGRREHLQGGRRPGHRRRRRSQPPASSDGRARSPTPRSPTSSASVMALAPSRRARGPAARRCSKRTSPRPCRRPASRRPRRCARRSSWRASRPRRSRSGLMTTSSRVDSAPDARCSAPGYVGLRALATGLPVSFLLNPRRALAPTPRRAAPTEQGAVHHLQHVGQRRSHQRQRARAPTRIRRSCTAPIRRWRPTPLTHRAARRSPRPRPGRRCRRRCSIAPCSGT